jgi:hypothetical protein
MNATCQAPAEMLLMQAVKLPGSLAECGQLVSQSVPHLSYQTKGKKDGVHSPTNIGGNVWPNQFTDF